MALAATYSASHSKSVEERFDLNLSPAASSPTSSPPQDDLAVLDAKSLIASLIFRTLTGRDAPAIPFQPSSQPAITVPASRQTVSVSYSRRETIQESERSLFRAEGSLQLASGKNIDFSFQLEMNRELTIVNGVAIRAGNAQDPIALNFDGAGVRLNTARESFDLNGDGVDELIATLATGSAWLAEDRNGNLTIDNGKELFGPTSGNGFRELAARDANHDGWITEDDPAYHRLGAWRDGAFTSLQNLGVGALATHAVTTPFDLKEGAELLGQVRQTSIYLTEDGDPGALQQVDLQL